MKQLTLLIETKELDIEQLTDLNNRAWDALHAHSGNDIRANWDKYKQIIDRLTKNIVPVSAKIVRQLENDNYHSLIKVLVQLNRVSRHARGWYKNPELMK